MRACGYFFFLVAAALILLKVGANGGDAPVASLRFSSYADGGNSALFVITNHTEEQIHCGTLTFDFRDSNGWSPYRYTITQWVDAPLPIILAKHANYELRAPLPSTQGIWRASIVCQRMNPETPSLKSKLLPILWRLGFENSGTGTVAVARLPPQSHGE
jgi:hypothetical protein